MLPDQFDVRELTDSTHTHTDTHTHLDRACCRVTAGLIEEEAQGAVAGSAAGRSFNHLFSAAQLSRGDEIFRL